MRTATIGAALAALLALGAPSAVAAPATVGASCEGPREGSVSAPGTHRFAQSFTPLVTGALTSAEAAVTKAPGTSGDWVMQLVESVIIPIGAPSDEVLATATIPDSTVPDGPSTITGRFADPATLVAGSSRLDYKLVVTRPSSTEVGVGYREGNDCPGGLSRATSQTGSFTPFLGATNDMVFRAYFTDVVAPQTRVVSRPKRRTARRRATFRFRASEAGASFECRLDRRTFEPCESPQKLRVAPGKHRFRTRATDLAGNVDPTPARFRWRVRG